eukprot:2562775-Pleurochrysis_carterae.AAC.1
MQAPHVKKVPQEIGGEHGDGVGRENMGERDGAAGVCARAFVAPLSVLTSDCRALRHITESRDSAEDSLHRDLDLAAGRSAVLARAQPF